MFGSRRRQHGDNLRPVEGLTAEPSLPIVAAVVRRKVKWAAADIGESLAISRSDVVDKAART